MIEIETSGREAPERSDYAKPERPKWLDWLFIGLLIVSSLLVGIVHVPQHKAVSPIDEYVYIDYLAKFPTQIVVRHGEETGPYARQVLACRGVRALGYYPAKLCRTATTAKDSAFPTDGTNTADIYTPLYFGVTWLLAQPVQWLGVHDLVDAGRFTGWVWLALASVLLYLSLKRLKVRPGLAFGLALLVVGSLPAYWSNTYISTDATAFAAGAAMLYLGTRLDSRSKGGTFLFVLVASLATLFKLQNFGAVALVALFLMLRAAWPAIAADKGSKLRSWFANRRTIAAIMAIVIPLVLQGIWLVIRAKLAVGPGGDQGVSQPFGLKAALNEAFNFFAGPSAGAVDPAMLGVAGVILPSVLAWVYIAGVLGSLAVEKRKSLGETLAISSLVIAFTIGPILAVVTLVTSGIYFPLPSRYGISLIPVFLASAGLLFTRKAWLANCVTAAAVGCFLISLLIQET